MKPITTQTRSARPLNYGGIYPSAKNPDVKKEEPFNTLAIYTYLSDVEYQVQARLHIPVMSHSESGPCRTVRGGKSAVVGIVP